MFEDENLDDLDIGFPSPTAPSSPGTRASSLEVPEARGKGQEEDFGECCSDFTDKQAWDSFNELIVLSQLIKHWLEIESPLNLHASLSPK